MSTGNHTLDDVAGGEVPSADESVLLEIPKFNWGAFFVPPIWGIVNRQWWGVLFLPAWVFVDNMLRSESTLGAWTTLAGIGMAAATLALQAVYARLADSLALRRVRTIAEYDRYMRYRRAWAVVGFLVIVGMGVWITLFILSGAPSQ